MENQNAYSKLKNVWTTPKTELIYGFMKNESMPFIGNSFIYT